MSRDHLILTGCEFLRRYEPNFGGFHRFVCAELQIQMSGREGQPIYDEALQRVSKEENLCPQKKKQLQEEINVSLHRVPLTCIFYNARYSKPLTCILPRAVQVPLTCILQRAVLEYDEVFQHGNALDTDLPSPPS